MGFGCQSGSVHIGIPAAKAESLFRGLMSVDADPQADGAALERTTLWALTIYSPIVAVDGLDGIVMDTEGADHLQGGDLLMVTGIANRFLARKLTADVVVADSCVAANACARTINRETIVIRWVRQSARWKSCRFRFCVCQAKIVADLRFLGLLTIGELASTPHAPLTCAFVRRSAAVLTRCSVVSPSLRADPDAELIEVSKAFAKRRRIVLVSLMAINGRIQRKGGLQSRRAATHRSLRRSGRAD